MKHFWSQAVQLRDTQPVYRKGNFAGIMTLVVKDRYQVPYIWNLYWEFSPCEDKKIYTDMHGFTILNGSRVTSQDAVCGWESRKKVASQQKWEQKVCKTWVGMLNCQGKKEGCGVWQDHCCICSLLLAECHWAHYLYCAHYLYSRIIHTSNRIQLFLIRSLDRLLNVYIFKMEKTQLWLSPNG